MMERKIKTSLLDNLWLWALLAFGIMATYGLWVLFEIMGMHGSPVIPHKP
jgi:hypothetical protein